MAMAPDHAHEDGLHLTVHGSVQGVGFRDGMVRMAVELGVAGWVRNRAGGTVEAVVRGPPAGCAAVVQWARRGPGAARVERVDVRPATAAERQYVRDGFHWRETI